MKTILTRPDSWLGALDSLQTLVIIVALFQPQHYNQDVIHAWQIDKTDRFLVFH